MTQRKLNEDFKKLKENSTRNYREKSLIDAKFKQPLSTINDEYNKYKDNFPNVKLDNALDKVFIRYKNR